MGITAELEAHRRDPDPHPNLQPHITNTQLAGILAAVLAQVPAIPIAADTLPSRVRYGTPASVGSLLTYARADHTHELDIPDVGSIETHLADFNNPHQVTPEQINAVPMWMRGAISGVATLNVAGHLPAAELFGDTVPATNQVLFAGAPGADYRPQGSSKLTFDPVWGRLVITSGGETIPAPSIDITTICDVEGLSSYWGLRIAASGPYAEDCALIRCDSPTAQFILRGTGMTYAGGSRSFTALAATGRALTHDGTDDEIALGRTVAWAAGANSAEKAAIRITAPIWAGTTSTTLEGEISTVLISGPPSAGSAMTFGSTSGGPWALRVASGNCEFNGKIKVGSRVLSEWLGVELYGSVVQALSFNNDGYGGPYASLIVPDLSTGFDFPSPGTNEITFARGSIKASGSALIAGSAPSSVSSGQVAIGGGLAYFGPNIRVTSSGGNGYVQAYNGSAYNKLFLIGAGITINSDTGNTLFIGTAPSSVASGEVKIGGGRIWSGQNGGGPGLTLLDTAASGRRWEFYLGGYTANGLALYNRTDDNYPIEWLSDGQSVFRGAAPSSVSSGQVAIGGGTIWAKDYVYAAGSIYAGNSGQYAWKLAGYTASTITPTGKITVTINGTNYEIPARAA